MEGLDDAARLVAGPRGRTAGRVSRRSAVELSGPRPADAPSARGAAALTARVRRSTWPTCAASSRRAGRSRWRSRAATTCCSWTARRRQDAARARDPRPAAAAQRRGGARGNGHRERRWSADGAWTACGASDHSVPHTTPPRTRRWWGAVRRSCRARQPAHHGVLFLDELAEFDRPPWMPFASRSRRACSRSRGRSGHVRYPARFQLIAAMNPCRCGYFNDSQRRCSAPRASRSATCAA